jgi:hypothetical protein
MDQGSELVWSFVLSDMVLLTPHFVLEPTGADSPSQNNVVGNLLSVHVHSCMVLAFRQNTGLLHC